MPRIPRLSNILQKKFMFIGVNVENLENTQRRKQKLPVTLPPADHFNISMFLKFYFLYTFIYFFKK